MKKSLKGLLQNIYLVLELLYQKRNPLIMNVVDSIIFKNIYDYNLRQKR